MQLPESEIHVWQVDLLHASCIADLDEGERTRASRFHFERDRVRYIAAHSALRRILAPYLACLPTALRFATTEFGKPYIENSLHFNLSHSGDMALVAVSHGEVGVDVEHIRDGVEVMGIATRFLPAEETQELDRLTEKEQISAFFRLWTRREAYLKARGVGLGGISERIGSDWTIIELDLREGYTGAVATQLAASRVVQFTYPTADVSEIVGC